MILFYRDKNICFKQFLTSFKYNSLLIMLGDNVKPENKSQLLQKNDSNSPNIIIEKKLILYNNNTNFFLDNVKLKELLREYEGIMANKGRRFVYFYFLDNLGATASQIMIDTDMVEVSIHGHIKWLKTRGFIVSHGKIKSYKKGGPKPVLYALPGVTPDQLKPVIQKIQKSNRPTFKLVSELTQLCWEDIQDMEIQMSKIIWHSKKRGSGFHFLGIAELVAQELQSKKVKVWR